MLKSLPFLVLFLFLNGLNFGQSLRVSDDGHHLVDSDSQTFFYLGDTGWELFHRMDSASVIHYLKNRADKGFTVIQAVVLAEFDGLHTPNANGDIPLLQDDPTKPNEAYFQYVDFVVKEANRMGLIIGMLPTWGDKFNQRWGVGPEVFTPANARIFGQFLGERYRNEGIIWILGGDRIPEEEEDFQILSAMAQGLRIGDNGRHLITYHPMGEQSSTSFFQDSTWLDFNMFQSGHGKIDNPNYQMTRNAYRLSTPKPVLDGEPNYEDHPINWTPANGWFDAFESRRAGYWSMLAGACGHTYGCHDIWQFLSPRFPAVSVARTPWQQALDLPGSFQAGYMRKVFESRPWQRLVPRQDLLQNAPNTGGMTCMAAADLEGQFLMAYTPFGHSFTVKTGALSPGELQLWWYHPATGTSIDGGKIAYAETLTVDPPGDPQRGNDWVLIIDRKSVGFRRP